MTPEEDAPFSFDGHEALAQARLRLLAGARRRLCLHLPRLSPDAWASAAELAELRRIATAGRGAEIRLLLHEPEAAARDGHRLLELAQRLPSVWRLRTPLEAADRTCASAWLLTDAGGYLFLPDPSRPQGRAAGRDRAAQVPLQQRFDEVWERSARATGLLPLDL
ncbi:hypothetical protein QMK61_00710 [Fulvimonas sp. R45]|uniref:DUF7931 domain-containing protein n=1 Tax=Fulvimonas sp. R45 TaxID=3045937 RepID=UPI00265FD3C9|nr:hypothetical protein [Fulvimonas sp. R45]MDO1527342.1 hypothetical protein [Fulvimonas sp. R45]